MTYKLGDMVVWSSQAGGFGKEKSGEIVEVIPAGRSILKSKFRDQLDASTLPRRHESYVVMVPPKNGSKAKPKYYWPRVTALRTNHETA